MAENIDGSFERLYGELIKSYKGEIPLPLWVSYCQWAENNLPKHEYQKILENCFNILKTNIKYTQDEDFFKICMQHVSLKENKLEGYHELYTRGIGVRKSKLYVNWAECYINIGDWKSALDIYEKGFQCYADPHVLLLESCYNVIVKKLYLLLKLVPVNNNQFQWLTNAISSYQKGCHQVEGNDNSQVTREISLSGIQHHPESPVVLCSENPLLFYPEPEDPGKQPQYPKNKVYKDADKNIEYSLEEIRAEIYMKREKVSRESAASRSKVNQENINVNSTDRQNIAYQDHSIPYVSNEIHNNTTKPVAPFVSYEDTVELHLNKIREHLVEQSNKKNVLGVSKQSTSSPIKSLDLPEENVPPHYLKNSIDHQQANGHILPNTEMFPLMQRAPDFKEVGNGALPEQILQTSITVNTKAVKSFIDNLWVTPDGKQRFAGEIYGTTQTSTSTVQSHLNQLDENGQLVTNLWKKFPTEPFINSDQSSTKQTQSRILHQEKEGFWNQFKNDDLGVKPLPENSSDVTCTTETFKYPLSASTPWNQQAIKGMTPSAATNSTFTENMVANNMDIASGQYQAEVNAVSLQDRLSTILEGSQENQSSSVSLGSGRQTIRSNKFPLSAITEVSTSATERDNAAEIKMLHPNENCLSSILSRKSLAPGLNHLEPENLDNIKQAAARSNLNQENIKLASIYTQLNSCEGGDVPCISNEIQTNKKSVAPFTLYEDTVEIPLHKLQENLAEQSGKKPVLGFHKPDTTSAITTQDQTKDGHAIKPLPEISCEYSCTTETFKYPIFASTPFSEHGMQRIIPAITIDGTFSEAMAPSNMPVTSGQNQTEINTMRNKDVFTIVHEGSQRNQSPAGSSGSDKSITKSTKYPSPAVAVQPASEINGDWLLEPNKNWRTSMIFRKSLAPGLNHLQPEKADILNSDNKEDSHTSDDLDVTIVISGSKEINPFDSQIIESLLKKVNFPNENCKSDCSIINMELPTMKLNTKLQLGSEVYTLDELLGKGSYAKVYKAESLSHKDSVALKIQRPAFRWEFYIIKEIRKRLQDTGKVDYFINAHHLYILNNASVLVLSCSQYGSFLDLINLLYQLVEHPECFAPYFACEMLRILRYLNQCQIIHGDLKPDNFMVVRIPSNKHELSLQVIDFGRAIDMTLYPKGTTFSHVVKTKDFQCVEMMSRKPWTYQTDYFGVASSIHCLIFKNYMKVYKKNDIWTINKSIPRSMNRALWTKFFTKLLNVESCESVPDTISLEQELEKEHVPFNQFDVILDEIN